tara:strand:+ start:67 stop:234 length:168 start_codon:yes stop_codon:yes gene_type:complete
MDIEQFINKYRSNIDSYLEEKYPRFKRTDQERQLFVENDEYLYLWAVKKGLSTKD